MKPIGVLSTVALLFVASAAVRSGVGVRAAIAGSVATVDPGECGPTDQTDDVLAAFSARDAALSQREIAAAEKEQQLVVAEQEIAARLIELQQAEIALEQTLALADGAAASDIDRLTDVYANMKPRDAAALFSEMAPEFSAGFLIRMAPESAAGIMAGLEPDVAYAISVTMAGRNSSVPVE